MILGLSTRAGDNVLALGRPGIHIAGGGLASVKTHGLVIIGVDDKISGLGALDLKSIIQGATDVPQNPLESC